jgi:hypothetical protein
MSQQELLKQVIQALDQAEIQYMITGSVVSSLQGAPRSTHDIDIIIVIQKLRALDYSKLFRHRNFIWIKKAFLMQLTGKVCSV